MAYSDLLKDPRWQKRRLQILDRDKFTCQYCGNTEKTLNVHHIHYFSGMLPWQYHDDALITLCEDCHQAEEGAKKDMPNWLHHLTAREINSILGDYLAATWFEKSRLKLFTDTLNFLQDKAKTKD